LTAAALATSAAATRRIIVVVAGVFFLFLYQLSCCVVSDGAALALRRSDRCRFAIGSNSELRVVTLHRVAARVASADLFCPAH